MAAPSPARVLHFTHLDHLRAVVQHGLLSDTTAQEKGLLSVEIGNREIKARRRRRPVPLPPGGTGADYVPLYFAPRSPMLYAIHRGNVPEYSGGTDPLVYLVTTVERLLDLGCTVLTTDRNAVLDFATFRQGASGLDEIDWQLMKATMWNNTVEEPDRMERRMAECLVHRVVPWEAFTEMHVRTEARRAQGEAVLKSMGARTPVRVRPDWYF
jgi:hypothetical protein